MSSLPLITTIIPTYQRPQLLEKAIQSVLSQTYPHFQLYICDNASQDETAEVVSKFTKTDSRVKYYCHEKNLGLIANYQFGLKLVSTDFFSFLSDDDWLEDTFFETALALHERYPESAFVAGSTVIVSQDGKIVRIPLDEWAREGFFLAGEGVLEMIGKFPVPTTILFRKHVIQSALINEQNPTYWDCDFLLQIAASYPFAISKKKCGFFLNHERSYSSHQDIARIDLGYQQLIDTIENQPNLIPTIKEKARQLFIHDILNIYRMFFVFYLTKMDFNRSSNALKKYHLYSNSKQKKLFYSILLKGCTLFPWMVYGIRALRNLKHIRDSLLLEGKWKKH